MKVFIAATLALLGLGAGATAAYSSDADLVRCANSLDRTVYTLVRSVDLTARDCLEQAARIGAAVISLGDCIEADGSRRIAHSAARMAAVDAAACVERPSFAAADLAVARKITAGEAAALVTDLLGADPFETFIAAATTPSDLRCARSALHLASRLRLAVLRDYFACKAGVLHAAAFSDPRALADCFASGTRRAHVLARLAGDVAAACAEVQSDVVLPGSCAGAAGGLAACVAERTACRTWRTETAADRVGGDCDLRDDDALNESCTPSFVVPCGNGVLDSGEECDDNNTSDSDCCSSECIAVAAGAPCPDDGDACTTDLCTGNGACAHASECPFVFDDATDAAGIAVVHGYNEAALENPELEYAVIAGGVAAADYDGDGWVDLYGVGGTDSSNWLLRNLGDGTFEERAAAAGIDLVGLSGCGPVFADFDGDGHPDLLIGGVNGTYPSVYRNAGDGTFADVTSSTKIVANHNIYGGAFGDYDLDGDLDLYLASWVRLITTNHRLWRNDGDGTFTDVTSAAGVGVSRDKNELDWSFAPTFTDIDNDGLPDLLVTGDFGTSQVFHNTGNGVFEDATTSVISDENGMGSSPADYDNDGDIDWFVTSVLDPNGVAEANWGVSGNRFYRNTGDGTFEDVTDYAGVRDGRWGWASCAADFNLDGHLDIFHVNGFKASQAAEFLEDPSRLFIARGDGTFVERAVELGLDETDQGRGAACFDYDGDGDVDVFVANNDQPARLWRNGAQALGNGWLHVNVRGPAPNTQGIGARVYVTIGATTQLREIRAGSNFESQDPPIAYFGLGTAASVDEVRVLWPDGETASLTSVTPNQTLTVQHP